MLILVRFLIILLIVAGVVYLFLPRPVFVIQINKGKASVKRGRVSRNFLNAVVDIAESNDVSHGTIRGNSRRGHVSLSFSEDIPEEARQPLRNLWGLYR